MRGPRSRTPVPSSPGCRESDGGPRRPSEPRFARPSRRRARQPGTRRSSSASTPRWRAFGTSFRRLRGRRPRGPMRRRRMGRRSRPGRPGPASCATGATAWRRGSRPTMQRGGTRSTHAHVRTPPSRTPRTASSEPTASPPRWSTGRPRSAANAIGSGPRSRTRRPASARLARR